MFKSLQKIEPKAAAEQAAYCKWLDQSTDRQSARSDRTHGAEGVIPVPLWIVLFLSAGIIFLFMLFFADSGERAFVQATMMGGVAVVISSMLLLLWFLDNPYHSGVGGLPPTAMERTLEILDQQAKIVGLTFGDRPATRAGSPARRSALAQRRSGSRSSSTAGENRADHERARAQVDREEEREDGGSRSRTPW